ncbi:alpha/beta fold hydrolase [Gordonia shandongensis]|uniref:alpha/beta fold hydrolase n=1 Tax=Gordonia shandongensis TaxID=376351 RepID=UPI0004290B2D|nr:alpha/beta fold hydrolase [Gordonia shandongensis]
MRFTRRHRSVVRSGPTAAGVIAVTVSLLAGCAVGPDTGPGVVRGDRGDDADTADNSQPALSAPKRDLNWKPCGETLSDTYDTTVPSGVRLDCARMDVPVSESSTSATIAVGVVRARTEATPKDVAPIVLTSGVDLPSSRTLLTLAGSDGRALLDRRPIVAVDHRGIGTSGLIDCMTRAQRHAMTTNAAGRGRDTAARAAALSADAGKAADQCNDTLNPDQLNYSTADAAADLEQLRDRWDVDRLALLGIGDGASVTFAYAAEHPDNVGRLIVDSPAAYTADAKKAAEARARGVQNALTTFAERCAAANCGLGADGAAVLGRLLTGIDDDGLSDTEVLSAVTTELAAGDLDGPGLKRLASALTSADRGDVAALRDLAARAARLRLSDGQILATCNDLRGRPGSQEVPALAKQWSAASPLTATTTALDLLRCDGWGVTDAPESPDSFPVTPLLLIGQNDPINGAAAAESVIPLMLAADTAPTTVRWDGLGFSVAARSDCAADTIADYLGDTPLSGPAERSCPA